MTGTTLHDAVGRTKTHETASISDLTREDRYALIWWHPQVLSPLACKSCGGGSNEPLKLLQEIHAAGCDIIGLTYDKPERVERYLREIGIEYPILTMTPEDARAHGVAKQPGEAWENLPQRVGFLVDHELNVINRYEVHDPTVFLRTVRDDVKAGPPQSEWPEPKKSFFSRLLGR